MTMFDFFAKTTWLPALLSKAAASGAIAEKSRPPHQATLACGMRSKRTYQL